MTLEIDLFDTLDFVMYARSSSSEPQRLNQQFDQILQQVQALGRPWNCVGRYHDLGCSGQTAGQRPGFQRLLMDLRTGQLEAQLVLVESLDRLNRQAEDVTLQTELDDFGLMLLATDQLFCDSQSEVATEAL